MHELEVRPHNILPGAVGRRGWDLKPHGLWDGCARADDNTRG